MYTFHIFNRVLRFSHHVYETRKIAVDHRQLVFQPALKFGFFFSNIKCHSPEKTSLIELNGMIPKY